MQNGKRSLRDDMALKLIEARVHLSVVELFRALANRFEKERFGIEFGINAQDIEDYPRRSAIVPAANDVAVTNQNDELALVVIA